MNNNSTRKNMNPIPRQPLGSANVNRSQYPSRIQSTVNAQQMRMQPTSNNNIGRMGRTIPIPKANTQQRPKAAVQPNSTNKTTNIAIQSAQKRSLNEFLGSENARKKKATKRALTIFGVSFSAVALSLAIGLSAGFLIPASSEQNIVVPDQNHNSNNGNNNNNQNIGNNDQTNQNNNGSNSESVVKPHDGPMKVSPNETFDTVVWPRLNSSKKTLPLAQYTYAKNVNIGNYTQYVSFLHNETINNYTIEIKVKKLFVDNGTTGTLRFGIEAWLLNYPYPDHSLPNYINSTWSVYWDHFTISGFKPEPPKPTSPK